MQAAAAAADRIFEVLDAPNPIQDRPGAVDLVDPEFGRRCKMLDRQRSIEEVEATGAFDLPVIHSPVDDIPEPNQRGYQKAVEQGMTALFRATEGRALAPAVTAIQAHRAIDPRACTAKANWLENAASSRSCQSRAGRRRE